MLDVDIGLLTANDLTSKEQGRAFLELLLRSFPQLAPQRYGYYEPLKNHFNAESLEEALEAWRSCFLWKRKNPIAEGSVWTHAKNAHAAIYISTQHRTLDVDQLVKFFCELSGDIKVDFAYVNLFTKTEDNAYPYEMIMPFREGITTHELRRNLPNLSWGTVFGRPYVELFGRERILSAPAYIVQELASDIIYLQLSESLLDLTTKYAEVDEVRKKVKAHLNLNTFYDPSHSSTHGYKVPDFYLPILSNQAG